MKFSIYKIFPYICIEKSLRNKYGSTKGPVVLIDPKTANPTTLEHEEVHVAVWYCVTALFTPVFLMLLLTQYAFNIPLLIVAVSFAALMDAIFGWLSKSYKKHEEAFCYGRSAKLAEDFDAYIDHYREVWMDSYGKGFIELVMKYSKKFEN